MHLDRSLKHVYDRLHVVELNVLKTIYASTAHRRPHVDPRQRHIFRTVLNDAAYWVRRKNDCRRFLRRFSSNMRLGPVYRDRLGRFIECWDFKKRPIPFGRR